MTATLTASHVSRELRRHDFRPLPSGTHRSRYGMRVQSHPVPECVSVAVDLPTERRTLEIAAAVTETLEQLGYLVEVNPELPGYLTVTRTTDQEVSR